MSPRCQAACVMYGLAVWGAATWGTGHLGSVSHLLALGGVVEMNGELRAELLAIRAEDQWLRWQLVCHRSHG